MRENKLLFLTNLILVFFIGLGIIFLFFWRVGILRKETELTEEANLVKEKIKFINSYNFKEFSEIIKNLSVEKIEIPPIGPSEIGKEKLF